jgi:hypothetical protein
MKIEFTLTNFSECLPKLGWFVALMNPSELMDRLQPLSDAVFLEMVTPASSLYAIEEEGTDMRHRIPTMIWVKKAIVSFYV